MNKINLQMIKELAYELGNVGEKQYANEEEVRRLIKGCTKQWEDFSLKNGVLRVEIVDGDIISFDYWYYPESEIWIDRDGFEEEDEKDNFTNDEVEKVDKALSTFISVLGNHFEEEITDYEILEQLIGIKKANEITDLLVKLNKGKRDNE